MKWKKITKSLFSKIMGSYILIPLLILLILVVMLPHYLQNYFFQTKKEELLNKAQNIKNVLLKNSDKTINQSIYNFENMLNTGIIIINEEREIVNHGLRMQGMMREYGNITPDHPGGMMNPGNPRGHMMGMMGRNSFSGMRVKPETILEKDEGIEQVLSGENIIFQGESPLLKQTVIAVGVPIQIPSGNLALFLISRIETLRKTSDKIRNLTLQITLLGIIFSLIIAFFIARGIVRPIKNINNKAHQLAAGNYDIRLDNLPADEIGELGETFNFLAEKLEENISDLNSEKNRMQSMLTSMAEGVLGISTGKNIILANPELKDMFDLNDHILKKNINKYFPQELTDLVNSILNNKREEKKEIEWENKIYVLQGSPIYKNKSNFIGVILLVRDVTQIRKLEQMRRLFVANVSHELKTPLTSVRGYIEAILDGVIENKDDQKKYLNKVLNETERMNRLVKDILNLSRLQSGQIDFNYTEFNLVEVVKYAIEDIKTQVTSKDITLNSPEKIRILSDKDRIKEVMINLLSNAIKFTEKKGTININLIKENEKVKIKVIDNGIGIPACELPYIWERFHQVDRSRRLDKEGTGLGLAIVKEIIEGVKGEIKVKSKEGEGTEFEVTIPVSKKE